MLLKDFADIECFEDVVADAKDCVTFIYNHQKSLVLFRQFKKTGHREMACDTLRYSVFDVGVYALGNGVPKTYGCPPRL